MLLGSVCIGLCSRSMGSRGISSIRLRVETEFVAVSQEAGALKHKRAKPVPEAATMRVAVARPRPPRGAAAWGGLTLPCALGAAAAVRASARATAPRRSGRWRLREVLYRADRVTSAAHAACRCEPIRRNDGWCDAVGDRNYNRCGAPSLSGERRAALAERWALRPRRRLGHNDRPRVRGARQRHLHARGQARLRAHRGLHCACSARICLRLLARARRGSVAGRGELRQKKRPKLATPGAQSTYRGSGVLAEAAGPDGAPAAPQTRSQ